jgi:predicted extracellular nuclease
VVSGASPKAVSTATAAQATIGSFNLRRFFDDTAAGNEPVLSSSAYATRLAKTANAICAYAKTPDILGLAEIENKAALSDLAAAVNANDGNVLFPGSCKGNAGYRAYLIPGTSNSNLGFLVSTAAVRPGVARVEVLSVQALGQAATFRNRDGSTELLNARAPLLLNAKINDASGSSVTVTVIANELSALDGNLAAPGTHGWATRGDYLRTKRAAQALSLAQLIQARQRANPTEKLVVLGNFEANEFNDGHADLLGVLTGRETAANRVLTHTGSPVNPPLTNLTLQAPRNERYTVTREGNAEAVDHILVNQVLMAPAFKARVEMARIDADFGEDNANDTLVPMRSSDHDPVIMFLQMH